MAAYWLSRCKINDPVEYKKYTDLVPGIIAQYGGKYLVRGGSSTQLEGKAQGARRVVIEFASRAAAETWYHSTEYQAILPLRHNNSEGHLALVDGFDG